MKILVTGAAGFIGSHLMNRLVSMKHECVGIDNYETSTKDDKLFRLKGARLNHFGLQIKNVDIRIEEQVDELFKQFIPDVVIHLAASVGVRDSLSNPKEYRVNNIDGTENIISSCEKYGVKKVLYASTSSVYAGSSTDVFWSEDSTEIKHQISPYGYTKYVNECQFKMSNLNNIGMRFFTVYGPWGRPDMALYKFASLISEGLPITVYGDNIMIRDFTYVDDIINGVVLLLMNEVPSGEIFNIGRGKPELLSTYVDYLSQYLGVEPTIEIKEPLSVDPISTWCSTAKLRKMGYEPKVDIQEGVSEFVKWFKKYND